MTCRGLPDDEREALLAKMRIEGLLWQAEQARRGRDLWRKVGPILRSLREAGVPYRVIRAETGISYATISRLAAASRTGGRRSSEPRTS